MSDRLLHHFLLYGLDMLSVLLAIIALWRPIPLRSSHLWWAATLLGIAFIGRTIYFSKTNDFWGRDFSFLWWAGSYALDGKDPYTVKGLMPPNEHLVAFCYAPITLPFCKLIAFVSLATALKLITSINVVICLSLGLLARQVLIAQDGERAGSLSPALAALLTAPVILSLSTYFAVDDCQVSLLISLALLAALAVQARQPAQPTVAGIWLGLAMNKPQTMLPFLLLFLRRRDVRTWLCLFVIGATLLLAAGDPADLSRKFSAFRDVHAALREPGRPADNSMLNPLANTLMGFEHLFFRLGLVDRAAVSLLALACILILGLWLAYLINIKGTLPRGACCSLVSLYAMLFIYHRFYDLSILILPLIYSASRLPNASRPARWCYAWVVTAVLLALNAPYGELLQMQMLYASSPILRIFVLPSVTYLILSAMVALVVAASLESRHFRLGAALCEGSTRTPVFAR